MVIKRIFFEEPSQLHTKIKNAMIKLFDCRQLGTDHAGNTTVHSHAEHQGQQSSCSDILTALLPGDSLHA